MNHLFIYLKNMGGKNLIHIGLNLPNDDIHDEAVAQQTDHKHHGVDRGDDGDDGRHALLLPALIMGHIAALWVSGHPGWRIEWTVLQQRGQALIVFFENFYRSAFHFDTCSLKAEQVRGEKNVDTEKARKFRFDWGTKTRINDN